MPGVVWALGKLSLKGKEVQAHASGAPELLCRNSQNYGTESLEWGCFPAKLPQVTVLMASGGCGLATPRAFKDMWGAIAVPLYHGTSAFIQSDGKHHLISGAAFGENRGVALALSTENKILKQAQDAVLLRVTIAGCRALSGQRK